MLMLLQQFHWEMWIKYSRIIKIKAFAKLMFLPCHDRLECCPDDISNRVVGLKYPSPTLKSTLQARILILGQTFDVQEALGSGLRSHKPVVATTNSAKDVCNLRCGQSPTDTSAEFYRSNCCLLHFCEDRKASIGSS